MTQIPSVALLAAFSIGAMLVSAPVHAQPASLDIAANPAMDVGRLAPGGLEHALETLDETVQSIMERSGVPGVALAVVHGGETILARGYGVREVGKPDLVGPQTVFQIASVSKPLASTVAAIAITDGLVSWDDPVIAYLPDFRLADALVTERLTIGDLYAHRSGLPLAPGDDLEDLGFSREQIMARLHLLPLDAFRTSYHYANFGITTGAQAVAAAAGESWEDLAQSALYGPLRMDHTSSRHADFLAQPDRASLHALVGGKLQPLYQRESDEQSPAGGVSSNVTDLAEWLKLLLADGKYGADQLIDPAVLQAALSPQAFSNPAPVPSARPAFYGYGFNVGVGADGRTTFGHSGAFTLGAATRIQFVPSADIGIVVLTNAGPLGVPEAIANIFLDTVQYGGPTRDWYAGFHALMAGFYAPVGDLADAAEPTDPVPAQPLADYAGTYLNEYFGPLEIVAGEDGLIARLGPRGDRFALNHWDGDVFAIAPRNENAPDGSLSSVRFDRSAGTVRIDYLDQHGLALWQR